jgi:hypothetical protein
MNSLVHSLVYLIACPQDDEWKVLPIYLGGQIAEFRFKEPLPLCLSSGKIK